MPACLKNPGCLLDAMSRGQTSTIQPASFGELNTHFDSCLIFYPVGEEYGLFE
jgi:hypothetical protein